MVGCDFGKIYFVNDRILLKRLKNVNMRYAILAFKNYFMIKVVTFLGGSTLLVNHSNKYVSPKQERQNSPGGHR